jgi:hypothetical protein
MLSLATTLAAPDFSTLSHKQRDCQKKKVVELQICTRWFKYDRDYLCVNKSHFVPVIFEPLCILILYKPRFDTFLILKRFQWDVVINVHKSLCEVPVIPVGFKLNMRFLDRFSKKTYIPSFIKIRPVGGELFHADGQTDRQMDRYDELIVAFRILANAPKKRKRKD